MGKIKRSRERIDYKCEQCGKECNVRNYRKGTARFCSRKCTALGTRIKYTTTCKICGKIFEHIAARCNKAKYCSPACYQKSRIGRGYKTYYCFHCHEEFKDSPSRNRKYCSIACNKKGIKETWKASFSCIREKMETRGLIKECAKCGYNAEPRILGVHHIDRNRNNNEFQNLIVLCPNCHSLEHQKHITHGSISKYFKEM